MKIDILTLFPDMFSNFLNQSIIKRAIEKSLVEINITNFRDYSKLNNKQVDDTPYGGGAGMVLMCEPIVDAIEALKTKESKVILMSPQGKVYKQDMAVEFKNYKHLIIVCGHYEGFDERIKNFIDFDVSIGDYILTGGEIPAMVICDSVIRLVDNVINYESAYNDSFTNNLLDYPTYTKPRNFRGLEVPEVLLSGNHEMIRNWRAKQQVEITKRVRPDLISKDEKDI